MKAAIGFRGGVSKTSGQIIENICRHSDYVNIECTKRSVMKHIVEANPEYDFDFFIHCWDMRLQSELLSLYNPKKFCFERNDRYTEELKSKGGYYAQASHYLSMKKLCEMIMSVNDEYDYVVLYRPDVMLWKDMILSQYDKSSITVNNWKTIAVNHGDFHFVCSKHNLKSFVELYDNMRDPIPHKLLNISEIKKDDIFAGVDQEVTRKLKHCNLSEETLNAYGLTQELIDSYDVKV